MDKKLNFGIHIEGKDVDKLNILRMLEEKISSEGMDVQITSGHSQVYYTKKEKQ